MLPFSAEAEDLLQLHLVGVRRAQVLWSRWILSPTLLCESTEREEAILPAARKVWGSLPSADWATHRDGTDSPYGAPADVAPPFCPANLSSIQPQELLTLLYLTHHTEAGSRSGDRMPDALSPSFSDMQRAAAAGSELCYLLGFLPGGGDVLRALHLPLCPPESRSAVTTEPVVAAAQAADVHKHLLHLTKRTPETQPPLVCPLCLAASTGDVLAVSAIVGALRAAYLDDKSFQWLFDLYSCLAKKTTPTTALKASNISGDHSNAVNAKVDEPKAGASASIETVPNDSANLELPPAVGFITTQGPIVCYQKEVFTSLYSSKINSLLHDKPDDVAKAAQQLLSRRRHYVSQHLRAALRCALWNAQRRTAAVCLYWQLLLDGAEADDAAALGGQPPSTSAASSFIFDAHISESVNGLERRQRATELGLKQAILALVGAGPLRRIAEEQLSMLLAQEGTHANASLSFQVNPYGTADLVPGRDEDSLLQSLVTLEAALTEAATCHLVLRPRRDARFALLGVLLEDPSTLEGKTIDERVFPTRLARALVGNDRVYSIVEYRREIVYPAIRHLLAQLSWKRLFPCPAVPSFVEAAIGPAAMEALISVSRGMYRCPLSHFVIARRYHRVLQHLLELSRRCDCATESTAEGLEAATAYQGIFYSSVPSQRQGNDSYLCSLSGPLDALVRKWHADAGGQLAEPPMSLAVGPADVTQDSNVKRTMEALFLEADHARTSARQQVSLSNDCDAPNASKNAACDFKRLVTPPKDNLLLNAHDSCGLTPFGLALLCADDDSASLLLSLSHTNATGSSLFAASVSLHCPFRGGAHGRFITPLQYVLGHCERAFRALLWHSYDATLRRYVIGNDGGVGQDGEVHLPDGVKDLLESYSDKRAIGNSGELLCPEPAAPAEQPRAFPPLIYLMLLETVLTAADADSKIIGSLERHSSFLASSLLASEIELPSAPNASAIDKSTKASPSLYELFKKVFLASSCGIPVNFLPSLEEADMTSSEGLTETVRQLVMHEAIAWARLQWKTVKVLFSSIRRTLMLPPYTLPFELSKGGLQFVMFQCCLPKLLLALRLDPWAGCSDGSPSPLWAAVVYRLLLAWHKTRPRGSSKQVAATPLSSLSWLLEDLLRCRKVQHSLMAGIMQAVMAVPVKPQKIATSGSGINMTFSGNSSAHTVATPLKSIKRRDKAKEQAEEFARRRASYIGRTRGISKCDHNSVTKSQSCNTDSNASNSTITLLRKELEQLQQGGEDQLAQDMQRLAYLRSAIITTKAEVQQANERYNAELQHLERMQHSGKFMLYRAVATQSRLSTHVEGLEAHYTTQAQKYAASNNLPPMPIALDERTGQVSVFIDNLCLWVIVPPPPCLLLEVLDNWLWGREVWHRRLTRVTRAFSEAPPALSPVTLLSCFFAPRMDILVEEGEANGMVYDDATDDTLQWLLDARESYLRTLRVGVVSSTNRDPGSWIIQADHSEGAGGTPPSFHTFGRTVPPLNDAVAHLMPSMSSTVMSESEAAAVLSDKPPDAIIRSNDLVLLRPIGVRRCAAATATKGYDLTGALRPSPTPYYDALFKRDPFPTLEGEDQALAETGLISRCPSVSKSTVPHTRARFVADAIRSCRGALGGQSPPDDVATIVLRTPADNDPSSSDEELRMEGWDNTEGDESAAQFRRQQRGSRLYDAAFNVDGRSTSQRLLRLPCLTIVEHATDDNEAAVFGISSAVNTPAIISPLLRHQSFRPRIVVLTAQFSPSTLCRALFFPSPSTPEAIDGDPMKSSDAMSIDILKDFGGDDMRPSKEKSAEQDIILMMQSRSVQPSPPGMISTSKFKEFLCFPSGLPLQDRPIWIAKQRGIRYLWRQLLLAGEEFKGDIQNNEVL